MQAGDGAAAGKPGRPKRDEGTPPMPRSWKKTERLAGTLAYLEVSECGPNATLEVDVAKAYGTQLVFVDGSVDRVV